MSTTLSRPSAARTILFLLVVLVLLSPPLAPQDLGFERDRMKMILETVSREVEKNFYDSSLRGLNWKQLTDETRQRIEKANSVSEMITAIFSLVDKLKDSHTVFLPPGRIAHLRFGFEAKAFGDEIRVYELDEKGPAAAAGLQRGDRIWTVNNFNADRGSFQLMMLYFRVLRPAVALDIVYSRGNEAVRSTHVKAAVQEQAVQTDLTRVETIYQLIREAEEEEEEKFLYGTYADGQVGYLYLPYFTAEKTTWNGLADKVKKQRAFIVDLRGNPGGAVDGLTYFVGFFGPETGTMAAMVGREKNTPMDVKPRKPQLSGPLFILVDSESASAAEIFAYHFQSTNRAVVIGDRTSARVTAARFYDHKIGTDVVVPYGVQVAVARVVFAGNQELENKGVVPNRLCLPTPEDLQKENDACLALAVKLAQEALEPASAPPKPGN